MKYRGYEHAKIKSLDLSPTAYAEIFSYEPKIKGKYKFYYDNGRSGQPEKPERKYLEILQYHNLTLARFKPKFK